MSHPRAFTLIETMLAVGLLAVLAAVAFPLLSTVARDRQRLVDRSSRAAHEAAAIDLLERALLTATGETFDGAETTLTVTYRHRSAAPGDERRTLSLAHDTETGTLRSGPTTLLSDIGRVRLRYHSGAAWERDFAATERQPFPRAVEIAWSRGLPTEDTEPLSLTTEADRPFDVVRVISIPDAAGVQP